MIFTFRRAPWPLLQPAIDMRPPVAVSGSGNPDFVVKILDLNQGLRQLRGKRFRHLPVFNLDLKLPCDFGAKNDKRSAEISGGENRFFAVRGHLIFLKGLLIWFSNLC